MKPAAALRAALFAGGAVTIGIVVALARWHLA
jgi:hypothetical protein